MIKDINKILYESRVSETMLPVVPISEWMKMLEIYAKNAREERLRHIVSPSHICHSYARYVSLNIQPLIKIRAYLSVVARMDDIIRVSGKTDLECGGIPTFVTDAAQEISPTLRDLPPLSSRDFARWVHYWIYEGMFERNEPVSKSAKGSLRTNMPLRANL